MAFGFKNKQPDPPEQAYYPPPEQLPMFHPATPLLDLGGGDCMTIEASLSGAAVSGMTGSGKTSGVGSHLATSYLANGYGMLVLGAKKEDLEQWIKWVKRANRQDDFIVIDAVGTNTWNFLDWENSHGGAGAGITKNIVLMLDELAPMMSGNAGKEEGGGDNKFWEDSLHNLNVNLVDLCQFAGMPVNMQLMAALLDGAPTSLSEANSPDWLANSICAEALRVGEEKTAERGDLDEIADFELCRTFFLRDWAKLPDKTRGIIEMTAKAMFRPFLSRPLRRLLCGETNVYPELLLEGAVIFVNLPVTEFREIGRAASIVWKFCTQRMILRRPRPKPGTYLRPISIFCDEAQNFITKGDAEFQSIARSQASASVYMTQARDSYKYALKDDTAVNMLMANLGNKFMGMCTENTAEYCSKLLGERYVRVEGGTYGIGGHQHDANVGTSWSEQKRAFLEPSFFSTLRRGGEACDRIVDCVCYLAGRTFEKEVVDHEGNVTVERVPYKVLSLRQSND